MENTNTFGPVSLFFVEEGTGDGAVTTAWFTDKNDAVASFGRAKARLSSSFFPEPGDYVLWGTATVETVAGVALLLNRGRFGGNGVTVTDYVVLSSDTE